MCKSLSIKHGKQQKLLTTQQPLVHADFISNSYTKQQSKENKGIILSYCCSSSVIEILGVLLMIKWRFLHFFPIVGLLQKSLCVLWFIFHLKSSEVLTI